MHNTPCTVTVRPVLPARVRAAAKLTAYEAAVTRHASQYCGAVVDTLRWGAGRSIRSVSARPEAELFAASCTMPETLGTPQRFVPTRIVAAAVNPCK